MTVKEAEAIVGGLSQPSKMPAYTYSLPAKECNVGSLLHTVKNSVCADCYALKGRYIFDNVQAAQYRRLEALEHPQWVEAMAFLINKRARRFPEFRWHDSGDIQSHEHLDAIVRVVKLTPEVKHWLPTREYGFVSAWRKDNGPFPENLCIRLSGYMVNGPAPLGLAKRLGVQVSSVSDTGDFTCPSMAQSIPPHSKCEHCGKVNNTDHNMAHCCECRACWDTGVPNVTYKKH